MCVGGIQTSLSGGHLFLKFESEKERVAREKDFFLVLANNIRWLEYFL
jgi:hypothetical protein